MKAKYYIKNVDGLVLPKRANETDAGYDVVATSTARVAGDELGGGTYKRIDYIEYETNLYIAPEAKVDFDSTKGHIYTNFHTDLRPRSSISKYNLVLANSIGLIDRGYRNQVLVRFKYIWNPEDYSLSGDLILGVPNLNKIYNKGDKICQLVPMETHDIDFTIVDVLDNNDRGGGFGSTDKPKPEQVSKPINRAFQLKEKTTVEKFFGNVGGAKMEMARAHYANYSGELYAYEENGFRGICVIDSSGTVLVKTPMIKL